ncbi:melanocyte-stimulating hormone receptor [Pristis pectinata]|uniref:melanocyte-stimulating hormone receptor n=1 Tax=Pristis pectinata TaxID=685728 RepID=UPI00223DE00F|nr:melanocyte-stimulating hormone receptor [Pristis pectinata]
MLGNQEPNEKEELKEISLSKNIVLEKLMTLKTDDLDSRVLKEVATEIVDGFIIFQESIDYAPHGPKQKDISSHWLPKNVNNSYNMSSLQCEQINIPEEVFLTLGILSFVENILVIVAITKNRNLHSPMHYFICCLAVADMLVSLSNAIETIVLILMEKEVLIVQNHILKQIDNLIDLMICTSMVSSLSFLAAIAADRYVTIFYALRYHAIMTTRNAVIIIVGIWIVSSTSSIMFIIYSESSAVIICLISFFFVMLMIMGGLYFHMFTLAQIHTKKIMAQRKNRPTHQAANMKGAITLTILLGLFLICWSPFFLHLLLIISCPNNPYCLCFTSHFNMFLILIICNSVFDPVIYAFRSRELRKTLKELVQKIMENDSLQKTFTQMRECNEIGSSVKSMFF